MTGSIGNHPPHLVQLAVLAQLQYLKRELDRRNGLVSSPVITKPAKGRDRNLPCLCGSGKKLKRCCGG